MDMEAYAAGYAMGARHALTGDPDDYSDERCLPLERELDTAAHDFDPTAVFGSPAFRVGYEAGYDATLMRQ